ncbi:MAG TPA: hypothetical protein VFI42_10080 [Thermomicrobiaceae bacterium]|nr:hypothetical protein [Thermomicrobiaceae bacterium]
MQWQADAPVTRDEITVTGRRLDGFTSEPARLTGYSAIGSSFSKSSTWSSELAFPSPGCWQLDAVFGSYTLSAVVYVYPSGCRPEAMGRPVSPTPCRPSNS